MTIKNLNHALLLRAVALTVFASALYAQVPKTAPKAAEIIQLAEKALGGDDFFRPKPYQLTYAMNSRTSDDGNKIVDRIDTYKDEKYHMDASVLIKKRGRTFYVKTISQDVNKNESWQFLSSHKTALGAFEKQTRRLPPPIPHITKGFFSGLLFDTEIPAVIKQGGKSYYKLEAKYKNPNFSSHSVTLLIDTNNHLVYKRERRDTNGKYKEIQTFADYVKVQNIMIPKKAIYDYTSPRGHREKTEANITNFQFRDDIADSLFELPSLESMRQLPAPSQNFEFFESTAHPEWVPPDAMLEGRLKASVVDIVSNYPQRNELFPEVLEKLSKHLEDMLRATGGRIERQAVQWKGGDYANIIASYGSESGPRIVVGAHYDAVKNIPGADDNASGVAVLLELARHLGKNPPKIRVDLAAYTLHEADFPESGGRHHARALKAKNVEVKAMIALEMVGYFSDAPKSQIYPVGILKLFYPSKGNYITVVGKPGSGSRKIIKKAMAKATPLPVRSFVGPVSLFGFFTRRSDHSLFWDEGYPGVMITDTSEFRNFAYHTPDDVPERLDYRRMAMVAVGVMNAIKVLGQ